ncbi:MAG: sugar ABC transporter ATP-binding protein [Rhizobiaceae bacterium]|nr:sugar ABC transporter ATP-binding protein [Rhizobiaceae bacterium]
MLRLQGISKYYHSAAAVRNVDLEFRAGECHALLGENGAGKSTLSKLISGVTQPTEGAILLDGKPVSFRSPIDGLRSGIVMVHQETSLVPSMTVAQNLFLGDETWFNRKRKLEIEAQIFLNSLNFEVSPEALVSSLGSARKQMVEIARAVRQKARLIIFDEPTATLTPEEKSHFFALLARLRRDGVAIVFISHALEEALQIADRITVLRDGQVVSSGQVTEYDRARIVSDMVGRSRPGDVQDVPPRKVRPRQKEVLSVRNLSMGKVVRNTSFTVYAGQVTGMFGLVGSGRTETARIIAGLAKRDFFYGGDVMLEGRPVRYRVPRQAMFDGIAYVTEDRKHDGFFETMSIADNLGVAAMARSARFWALPSSRLVSLFHHWKRKLDIKTIDEGARVVELSGGNQQKVVIARSLQLNPRIVILDEPTRGVDVGAIAEIHKAINALADEGYAVILISSYLPEVMAMSDRVLVSRAGKIVEEFSPETATEQQIMYAAVH